MKKHDFNQQADLLDRSRAVPVFWVLAAACVFWGGSLVVASAAEEVSELRPPAAEPLVMGKPTRVLVEEGVSVLRRFEVEQPGLITLAALGGPGGDLALMVADDLGQDLQEGFLDADFSDAPGGEYGAVALTRPGTYYVALRSYEGRIAVDLFALFQPLDGFVAPAADPHCRPDQALPLKAAMAVEQPADADGGDVRDWYRFVASRDGVVRFRTSVPPDAEADLKIEVYINEDFTWPTAEGDRDEDGRQGDEYADLAVSEGEVVFVRVDAWSTEGPTKYTMEARWMR